MKLLANKNEKHLVEVGEINTSRGIVKVRKKGIVKSHLGEKFIVSEPNLIDLMEKLKRGPQVILPKDLGIIVAFTGLRPKWKILDAGTGSGFSAIFLANLVPQGKVYTYEKDERFYKIAKENIRKVGLKNIILKKGDVRKVREKDFDLALLDLEGVEKIIKKIFKRVKLGGWIVIYSPTIDEVRKVREKSEKLNTLEIRTIEVLVREWQYTKTLRPKTKGIVHTGFITFIRKFY